MTNHYKHHPMFKFIISFGFIIVMNFQNTYRYELATHGRITLEERVWYLSRQTRLKESLWQITNIYQFRAG